MGKLVTFTELLEFREKNGNSCEILKQIPDSTNGCFYEVKFTNYNVVHDKVLSQWDYFYTINDIIIRHMYAIHGSQFDRDGITFESALIELITKGIYLPTLGIGKEKESVRWAV